jgi:chemotaxis protein CheX
MAAIDIKENEMPEVITNCVSGSVASIFNTIIGATPSFLGNDNDKKLGDGVVGIISFVGDASWILMLALPKASAESMANTFCGFEVGYESPEMGDVVGELANVLAGDIVARLGEEDIKVVMSLPTVMRGHDVEPLMPRGLPDKKMHFSLAGGDFMVKIAVANKGEMMGRTPGT